MRDGVSDDDAAAVRLDLDPLAIAKPGGLSDFTGKADGKVFSPLANCNLCHAISCQDIPIISRGSPKRLHDSARSHFSFDQMRRRIQCTYASRQIDSAARNRAYAF